MQEIKGHIHSTESFGTVDGPGIRFVVFFQGCPMRCLYCHNPDTWPFNEGTLMTADEILDEFSKQKEFYRKGGITATGGEPMAQLDFLVDLFTKARARGIHTCLDSSGIVFDPKNKEKFRPLMEVTSLVMLDIKHIDDQEHYKLTKQHNTNILEYAKFISDCGVELWIRHVVVPGITDDPKWLHKLGEFIVQLKTLKALDVLPYHTMGKVKYEQLGLDYPLGDTEPLSQDKAIEARKIIIQGMKDKISELRSQS